MNLSEVKNKLVLPEISDLLNQAKSEFLQRKQLFFAISLIPGLIWYVSSVISGNIFAIPLVFILGIAGVVFSLLAVIALILAIDDPKQISWKPLFEQAREGLSEFFFVFVLTLLAISIGYMLLVIPGIYLTIVLLFTLFVQVLDNKKGWKAAEASMDLVKGYWFPVCLRLLAILGLIIVYSVVILFTFGMLSGGNKWISGLGALWIYVSAGPFFIIYQYLIYKHLKAIREATA